MAQNLDGQLVGELPRLSAAECLVLISCQCSGISLFLQLLPPREPADVLEPYRVGLYLHCGSLADLAGKGAEARGQENDQDETHALWRLHGLTPRRSQAHTWLCTLAKHHDA